MKIKQVFLYDKDLGILTNKGRIFIAERHYMGIVGYAQPYWKEIDLSKLKGNMIFKKVFSPPDLKEKGV